MKLTNRKMLAIRSILWITGNTGDTIILNTTLGQQVSGSRPRRHLGCDRSNCQGFKKLTHISTILQVTSFQSLHKFPSKHWNTRRLFLRFKYTIQYTSTSTVQKCTHDKTLIVLSNREQRTRSRSLHNDHLSGDSNSSITGQTLYSFGYWKPNSKLENI